MQEKCELIYCYDGSFEGMLSCVFESFERKEIPTEIVTYETQTPSLFKTKEIYTDKVKAARILAAIPKKICPMAADTVSLGYLTCHPQKELLITRFLILGFRYGAKVTTMLAEETVNELNKAIHHMTREAHLLKGFVRFSDHNGVLIAEIEPKNNVLPLLIQHFSSRFRNETFLIYDKTNKMAIVYSGGRGEIVPLEELVVPPPDTAEQLYRKLWQTFYDTIAIKERYNPRCRMTLMPKRYWGCMTEFMNNPDGVPLHMRDGTAVSLGTKESQYELGHYGDNVSLADDISEENKQKLLNIRDENC